MSDWTAGYIADIGYTFGYYQELNPQRIKLAFLNKGLVCPEIGTACELGFGQGLSANLHAAASVTQWYGTDFNPAQASFAKELAEISGCGAKLYDEAFSEFASRSDLPDFDYIGLHGIWSWISDENRDVIVKFIRRKLKIGGVLYISYNTLPGWAAFGPMRHLMTEHAEIMGSEGKGIVSRIDDAIDFANRLIAVNPIYARANPLVSERLKMLKEQNRHYLAHEYFNKDWHPMHFATMAEWLESAKLSYACSAHYLDQIDGLNLTSDQQKFLKQIPDPVFRESVRDFIVNQQFRRDYWVKGPRQLSVLERSELLREQKVLLVSNASGISLKVTGSLGEGSMNASVYEPIISELADHKPITLGQLESALISNLNLAQILEAIMVLTGIGHVMPVQDDVNSSKLRKQTERINHHIIVKARSSGDIGYLASPVTGGAIPVGRFHQLFLLALATGKKQPEEWADFVWVQLSAQGQNLIKDGKPLERAEENLAELTAQAQAFATKTLPILKALQIV